MRLDRERVARLDGLIDEAYAILSRAIDEYVLNDRRSLSGVCVLFSGGNDSTVLAHLFRHEASHAIHANTGIGIEATRQFVRDACEAWDLPLIEEHPPPGSTYEELVIAQGFPGPAHHWKMYQRLKERALHQARNHLIGHPWRERVVFLAGRRREESARRKEVPDIERNRSIVWASPLVNWTKLDLNTYRARHDVPRNEVADLLHMSGECLCGSFAHRGELDEIGEWFPEVREHIEALERKVRDAGQPDERCSWGWGADRSKASKVGPMCSSCDARRADS